MNISFYNTLGKKDGVLRLNTIEGVIRIAKEDDYVSPHKHHRGKQIPVIALNCASQVRYIKFFNKADRDGVHTFLLSQRNKDEVRIPVKLMTAESLPFEKIKFPAHERKDLFWQLHVMESVNLNKMDAFRIFDSPSLVVANTRFATTLLLEECSDPVEFIAEIWAATLPIPKYYSEGGVTPFQYFKNKLI